MKKYDPLWHDVNTLLAYLRSSGAPNVATLVDTYYSQWGNGAPGELLREQIDKVQKRLNEAPSP